MNFNLSASCIDLNLSLTEELIRLYGIPCKIIFTQKLNRDLTFGDFSSFKADNKSVFEIFLMPENSEEFESIQRFQTQFGIPADSGINLYASRKIINELIQYSENSRSEIDLATRYKDLFGALIIMPNGMIMEITEVNLDEPGISNVFVYNSDKNVIKLYTRVYTFKKADELDIDRQVNEKELVEKQGIMDHEIQDLEKFFDSQIEQNNKQQKEAQKYNTKYDDIFGRF